MIRLGDVTLSLTDPLVLGVAAFVLLMLVLLWRAGRGQPDLTPQMAQLADYMQALGAGQTQLAANIRTVADAQTTAQVQVLATMERRLAEVQAGMTETLTGTAEKASKQLIQLQERLATIDRAQTNIEKLSGDVLSLQDILSNKQRRGLFGEIQLTDIVAKALPADSFTLQHTLSNGKRADCLVHLPNPPGPIVIDAKFPLEAYEALAAAETREAQTQALRALAYAVRKHIRDISERYIIEGETADGAIMFLPSEAVYAELHARLPEVVRAGFDARVWIVSPTTCMATLNTMRAILKDARMREQAGAIRTALRQLHRDVEIITEKAGKLETHLRQAGEDVAGVLTAASRAGKRADRLDNFDFADVAPDPAAPLPLAPQRASGQD
ncbi:DNA recombination protein RmuC [Loktanella fryxellensis]|uniref:DNA recombination protein RmuC homolog n=1 Tax=Loktanella fryxellensis TaxID=245187 RepID=A0A1H7ZU35_9RHOB|nr:DNA recombination protein RmuC [Loktanella fryxellensis]SEM61786.1 DNA recombination protein RmuC [Loktanella fryxellensis]